MAVFMPTLAELRARYEEGESHADAPPGEAERVVAYLRLVAGPVATADDLHDAIVALEAEEEMAAYRCREGIAVSHASDGWWLLFPYGAVPSGGTDPVVGPGDGRC